MIAFLDVKMRDPPEGGGADVDVSLGLDLPGAADHRNQVLARRFASRHSLHAGVAINNGSGDCTGDDNDNQDDEENFFDAHSSFLIGGVVL